MVRSWTTGAPHQPPSSSLSSSKASPAGVNCSPWLYVFLAAIRQPPSRERKHPTVSPASSGMAATPRNSDHFARVVVAVDLSDLESLKIRPSRIHDAPSSAIAGRTPMSRTVAGDGKSSGANRPSRRAVVRSASEGKQVPVPVEHHGNRRVPRPGSNFVGSGAGRRPQAHCRVTEVVRPQWRESGLSSSDWRIRVGQPVACISPRATRLETVRAGETQVLRGLS